MNFAQAQLEFQVRHYTWARARAEEERREEFPHFWLFKGGFYHFIKDLTEDDQKLFISALLKRSHRYAAAEVGETTSTKEKAIGDRFTQVIMKSTEIEKEIAVRKRSGDPMKFASKRTVQRAMLANFEKAFDYLGLEPARNVDQVSSRALTKYCGWIVQTSFFFGRNRSLIDYTHLIASEDQIAHPTTPRVTGPALLLANALRWINLGVMEWEYLTDDDIEPACDSVVALCREFFEQLPVLLKGLERRNVTPD
jgi:hypothetical protein